METGVTTTATYQWPSLYEGLPRLAEVWGGEALSTRRPKYMLVTRLGLAA